VFIHSATDDQGRADGYFYAVVVLAAHRVQSIGDVWLGDTLAGFLILTEIHFTPIVKLYETRDWTLKQLLSGVGPKNGPATSQ